MARVALLCLVAVLVTAATSAAAGLSCGITLTDVPMSGCVTCTEINITGVGRARRSGPLGGFGRKLLRRGGPRGPDEFFIGSMLVPSCTKCDTGSNFVLMTPNGTGPGHCGCAAGFGMVFTSNATVVVGNITKVIPQFACVQCAAGEVPLGPDSNVRPSFSNGTWTLVLINSTTTTTTGDSTTTGNLPTLTGLPSIRNNTRRHRNRTRRGQATSNAAFSSVSLPTAEITPNVAPVAAAAAAQGDALAGAPVDGVAVASHRAGGNGDQEGGPGSPGGMFSPHSPPPRPDGGDHSMFGGLDGSRFNHGDGGFDGHDFNGAGRPRYAPGQCVACPEGSTTTDGISCVAQ